MLLVATVGFGAILNAGTGAATIKHVSANIGNHDSRGVENTIRGSLAIASIGGGLLAIGVLGLFWFGDNSLFVRMGDPHILHVTGLAAAALVWIEQMDNVFASALRGSERYGLTARIEIAAKSGQMLLLALTLVNGRGLGTVYLVLAISAVIRMGAKMIITRSTLHLTLLSPKLSYAKEILNFSKWAWLQGLGGMVFSIADRFLVGSLLGAAALAQYSVVSQLAMQIHGLAAAGVSVVFPMVSRKRAHDPTFSIGRATAQILSANVLLCSTLALGLFLLGKPILNMWLGEHSSAGLTGLLYYLSLAYWLLALNITPYYVLLGVGKVRAIAIWVFTGGIAGLAPMIFAIRTWGLPGAGVGKLIYAIATLMLFIPLMQTLAADSRMRSRPAES